MTRLETAIAEWLKEASAANAHLFAAAGFIKPQVDEAGLRLRADACARRCIANTLEHEEASWEMNTEVIYEFVKGELSRIEACYYCGSVAHQDTPCPKRSADAHRFHEQGEALYPRSRQG